MRNSKERPLRRDVRAEDDFGEVYTDLSSGELDELVVYVTITGGYLVVETPAFRQHSFIQVVLEGPSGGPDEWLVEVRNGAAPPFFRARVDEISRAQAALRAWAFGEVDWHETLDWESVSA